MTIAEIFKNIRKSSGLSQIEMAEKLGIGQAAISAIESGKVPNPGYDVIKALIFNVGANPLYVFDVDSKVSPVMHPSIVKGRLKGEDADKKAKDLISSMEKALNQLKGLKGS